MEEDLNATPEERQNKIKARLKKFLRIRPPVDSLKKKGIYKGMYCFCGSPIVIQKKKSSCEYFKMETIISELVLFAFNFFK